ncbi:DUF3348 domain-containing protein [Parapusillimonas sp. SGNA-6]|nr:DUF3348 domain-containing protein [Parapusillimonas sp. SGNA-6]
MVQDLPRRTASSGPALIRLLARLTGSDVFESRQALPDRLGQWLGWTDAIAFSAVLNGPSAVGPATDRSGGTAWDKEYARVRAALEKAARSGGDAPSAAHRHRGRPSPVVDGVAPLMKEATFSTYRQRYGVFQQTMESSIANLRSRLRAALAAKGPEMARLAGLDAALEQALGEREMTLLAGVPASLERYFERLKQAAAPTDASSTAVGAATDGWLDLFQQNMQSVMLAELELRLQPVEGLLKALRAG